MKRLNASVLQRGDIILTTTGRPVSKGVRTATKSDFSHAALRSMQQAKAFKLTMRDGCSLMTNAPLHVLRLKAGLSPDQALAICQFVRKRLGSEYSKMEAARTVFGGSDQWTRKQFCSRLVA
jgi:hypothetical protein